MGVENRLQNGCFVRKSGTLSITFVVVNAYFGVLALGFEVVGEYL